jgi:mannose-6-phosphate isomerase
MENKIIAKPWGYYEDFFRSNKVVFKKIVVNPNSELSLQKHEQRGEFWYVAEGRGFIVYNDLIKHIDVGYSIEIPVGAVHCIANNTNEPLVIFEMQYGVCSEDDIIRLDDKYGRVNESDLGMGVREGQCNPIALCDNLKKENKDG